MDVERVDGLVRQVRGMASRERGYGGGVLESCRVDLDAQARLDVSCVLKGHHGRRSAGMTTAERIAHLKRLDRLFISEREARDHYCREQTQVNLNRWLFSLERYTALRDRLREEGGQL